MERVAPRDPVVQVVVLVQAHVVALADERVAERAVVREVLLAVGRTSSRRGSPPARSRRGARRRRSARSARSAGTRPPAGRSSGGRSCPDWRKRPPNRCRWSAVRVERGERAEARAHRRRGRRGGRAWGRARAARGRPRSRARSRSASTRSTSRSGCPAGARSAARNGRSSSSAIAESKSRSSEACSAYSGPSWTTSSGSELVGATPCADQRLARDVGAQEPRADRDVLERPGGASSSSSQTGRSYPSSSSTERSPNGSLARSGFVGVGEPLGRAVGALDLELVLEPREAVRPRELELPRARPAAPAELGRREPLERVAPQPHRLHVGASARGR